MERFTTHSAEETEKLAQKIAKTISPPKVVCLVGPLGAGKTAFARGFVSAFGIDEGASSPTFTIMHRYAGTSVVDHYDLYRLKSLEDLDDIGFFEQIEQNISLVEWADMFMDAMPADCCVISIEKGADDNERIITRTDGYENTGD